MLIIRVETHCAVCDERSWSKRYTWGPQTQQKYREKYRIDDKKVFGIVCRMCIAQHCKTTILRREVQQISYQGLQSLEKSRDEMF